jgi:hypothetical protein
MTMNRFHPYSGSRALLLALSSILLVACQPKHEIPAMTPEETQAIDTLTARLKPRCVGRYLIDLPIDFVLNPITTAKLEGVDITITPMERERFNHEFLAQRATLTATMLPGEDKHRPHLRKEIALPDGAAGGVFDRSETAVSSDRMGRMLELVAWRNGFRIVATIKATDTSFPEDADDSIAKQLKTDVPEKLAHLLNVYERVRGRNDLEVPTEQGVCFANGFLRGEPTDEEQIDLYYHLYSAKDVYFAFHSLSDLQQDDELLDRSKAIEEMLEEASGYTLRKGNVKGPIKSAQEWLMSKKSSESGLLYQHFTLEANAKIGSAMTPVLVLDMNAGIRIPGPALSLEQAAVQKPLSKTTFNEAQSVALWDKVTPTLRPRPVSAPAVSPTSSVAPVSANTASPLPEAAPRLPLGTSLTSGTRCPQSGSWQCAAANAIGGALRSFTAGETLSSVLVPVERSFLQRLKGAPQNALTGTVWTLVSYPDAKDPV